LGVVARDGDGGEERAVVGARVGHDGEREGSEGGGCEAVVDASGDGVGDAEGRSPCVARARVERAVGVGEAGVAECAGAVAPGHGVEVADENGGCVEVGGVACEAA